MKQAPTQWNIRLAKPNDIAFIYDTFLNSVKHCSTLGKSCRSIVFFEEYKQIIDRILHHSKTYTACLPEDENVIVGYMITENPKIVHFTFIKEVFKNLGVAKSLLYHAFPDSSEITYTHRTFDGDAIIRQRRNFIFNPFILYKKEIT